ncbi:YihY/virulence factor BrkB family protein [Psychromarinibacter sp. C21-152]|uniref:YihY/virulence factor BrkB family protein n=1 Tax=Psychromarinibacter sediminicola TaxID=3033385 RepID=A0AAE3NUA8_9RHOB|nr:YihY/virulence factor BrkB family protein [Psychromarinibacter sediminicola]MDF0601095.1 YihY/virulence factor BrkB family protein [Psychromarinibacter sediminicola]
MDFRRILKPLIPVWRIANGVSDAITERNLDLIAAGVAFYAMFAIFPAVAAIIALWGFLADPEVVEEQLGMLRAFVPDDGFSVLKRQVDRLIRTNESTLGWATLISTGVALWSTRAGVGALTRGLNAAYGTIPRYGFWGIAWSVFMTGALVLVALLALASVVVLPVLLNIFPLGRFTEAALTVAQWTLTGGVTLGTLGLLYRYAPNHRGRRPRWLSLGAVLALVIWAVASVAFSFYMANWGSYNEVYGSIGAIIALLMWFFISALSILLGAAVNAEFDERYPRERPKRFSRQPPPES